MVILLGLFVKSWVVLLYLPLIQPYLRELHFVDWTGAQPDNGNEAYCLEMNPINGWNDEICSTTDIVLSICEYNLPFTAGEITL